MSPACFLPALSLVTSRNKLFISLNISPGSFGYLGEFCGMCSCPLFRRLPFVTAVELSEHLLLSLDILPCFTACSLARSLSGLLLVADVQVFFCFLFWHSPYSALRQSFMPVSISFISLARFRPGQVPDTLPCLFCYRSFFWRVLMPIRFTDHP